MWRQSYGRDDQFQVVADIARVLKSLTLSYKNGEGLTIMLLSQLNRASYLAVNERLRKARERKKESTDLYDLCSFSESSELVNAADVALAIYADGMLKKNKRAKLQLLKNRYGETIEEGVDVLCLPEMYYFGDFNEEDTESLFASDYISELLRE
jgi:hypothetical protein